MPLEPGQPRPIVRRRVGTAFPLSPKIARTTTHDKVCTSNTQTDTRVYLTVFAETIRTLTSVGEFVILSVK